MLYIDMLSIILHDTCIHHSNVCVLIEIHVICYLIYACNVIIAFLLILLEYYTSSYIFRVYILQ